MLNEYKNGMTVKELKKLNRDWPEEDWLGDPTEVWVETGRNLSSPVTIAGMLNHHALASHQLEVEVGTVI